MQNIVKGIKKIKSIQKQNKYRLKIKSKTVNLQDETVPTQFT